MRVTVEECRKHEFWNIGISTTAIKGLISIGCNTSEDIMKADDKQLLKIRGLGPVGVEKIRRYTNASGAAKIRINALVKKKEELLFEIAKIDSELSELYKLED